MRALSRAADTVTRDLAHLQALSSRFPIISSRSSVGTRATQSGRDVERDGETTIHMEPLHRASQPGHRGLDVRDGGCARGGDARLGKMRVDLPAHPIDLFADGRRQIAVAGGLGSGHFLHENRERCLEAVRQIARSCHGGGDAALTFVEQGIEVFDERHDLGRILAFDRVVRPSRTAASRS